LPTSMIQEREDKVVDKALKERYGLDPLEK
jgi:hypothetical protein